MPESRRFSGIAFVLAAATIAAPARADMIVTEGMHPWDTCAECHSLDGVSVMARFPKLAGQRAAYIVKQVRDFSAGRRTNDGGQMAAIASEIGHADLARVVAYFSALSPPPPERSTAADLAERRRGAGLYRQGDAAIGIPPCSACHDGAEMDQPQVPLLKAQHAAYLAKQLRDWRAGVRTNDDSDGMAAIAARLSDQDITALAAYLASEERSAPDPERSGPEKPR